MSSTVEVDATVFENLVRMTLILDDLVQEDGHTLSGVVSRHQTNSAELAYWCLTLQAMRVTGQASP